MDWIQIRFDDDLARSVERAASRGQMPVGSYIRDILAKASQPCHPALAYSGPRKPLGLKAYLSHEFSYAQDWDDLQEGLRAKGYELAERGGGLILRIVEGERLCKASEIGQPYATLMKRFGAPFPNHGHRHLERQHLGQMTLGL
ncbi:hypothetical protein [Pacificibacter marinus]|uniref:Uncharacterized protein n=1 Tax=Pacificibacter marinus TaxID=658057 RepID=A0A1Y5S1F7_9RHOB|nr:hypothetical protein [Pacificibacter marinus]SEK93620.1 hypothetical protein SAMN04488032_108168 [Pacificibacter marinus]SLN30325.1 hypothetical protein PAM7971_01139 [Pacificibacter marinus]